MFYPLTRKIPKARRAARAALFALMAAFLFLAGLAYADHASPKMVPVNQESRIPIRNEESSPSLFPTKPVNIEAGLERFVKKPVRFFPGDESDWAIPTAVDGIQIAGVSSALVQTDRQQQVPYSIPQLPTLFTSK